MVKSRISATVERETVDKISKILGKGNFRNKSHVIEDAIDLLWKHVEGERVQALKELGGFE